MQKVLVAACVLLTAGCLRAAPGEVGDDARSTVAPPPSQLDYLVLASLADAQRPLAMAAYRPQAQGEH